MSVAITPTLQAALANMNLQPSPDSAVRSALKLGAQPQPINRAVSDIARQKPTWIAAHDLSRVPVSAAVAQAALGEDLLSAIPLGHTALPATPVTYGDKLSLLVRNENYLPRLYQDLEKAQHSITINQFSWEPNGGGLKVAELLKKKAAQGVDVKVMVDAYGIQEKGFKASRAFIDDLKSGGVKVKQVLPAGFGWKHAPEHRKLINIDSKISYQGGLGFGGKYDSWTDMMVRAEGPSAAVSRARQMALWSDVTHGAAMVRDDRLESLVRAATTTGGGGAEHAGAGVQILENRPKVDLAATEAFFRDARAATDRLWVTSTYVTTPHAVNELRAAAERGADVRMIVTGLTAGNDTKTIQIGRTHFKELMSSGVKIWEYPTIMHGKSWLADTNMAVGSMNLSSASMRGAREVMLRTDSPELIGQYMKFYEDTIAGAKLVTHADISSKGLKVLTAVRKLTGLRF